ncbi:uncharacterized protein LOC131947123 [Physella acuta]|uniref:uncharacterized protein LOC131947123 n=1 Tax=Physella acuta TaxID=109671 RepID=UPI0027DDF196|nr:uncharacterized protein LOC131947123 [Physella acuta]
MASFLDNRSLRAYKDTHNIPACRSGDLSEMDSITTTAKCGNKVQDYIYSKKESESPFLKNSMRNPTAVAVLNSTDLAGFRTFQKAKSRKISRTCRKLNPVLTLVLLLTVLVLAVLTVHIYRQITALEETVDRLWRENLFGVKMVEFSNIAESLTGEADADLQLDTLRYVPSSFSDDGRALSRQARQAKDSKNKNDSEGEAKKKQNKSGKKNAASEKATDLQSSEFEVNFFKDWYDYKTNFTKQECFEDERWPTRPKACRNRTLTYAQADSPLAFYVARSEGSPSNHKKRKRKSMQPLVEISDQKNGIFKVKEPGVYLIHFKVLMVDETETHSLGVVVNNQTMLACLRGGFTLTNNEGSSKFRLCVIDGVVEMKADDQLQLRTFEPNTVVRLADNLNSQFKVILLHKNVPA